MRSKASSFFNFLLSTCFPVYALCETWLTSEISNSEYFNDSYVIYRCDRSNLTSDKTRGGGVIIAIHTSLKSSEIACPNINVEYIAVKIMWFSKMMYLYLAYIPPTSSAAIYKLHCDNINCFVSESKLHDIVCVLGDFNLPKIHWNMDNDHCESLLLPSNVSSDEEQVFIDSMQALNLHQICKKSNLNGHFLDLIFLNEPNFGDVSKSLMPFSPESLHHCGLEINFDCAEILCKSSKASNAKHSSYNFNKADIPALNMYFDKIDWLNSINLDNSDINITVDMFYSILSNAFENHVPKTYKQGNNHPPWFNKNLINLRNKKNKIHKRMKCAQNNLTLLFQFKCLRSEFDAQQRTAYRNYISQLEMNLVSDPKKFWAYAAAKRKCSGYPLSMSLNNVTATNTLGICELFADFFQSVYKKHDSFKSDDNNNYNYTKSSNLICIPFISEQDVFNGILKMNIGRGADDIPSIILKNLANVLSYPLSLIFNKSLRSGIFPATWKISIIIPIFKSGKRSDIKNYRGISILSSIPKLFEMIVCDYLSFNLKSLISSQQHGFVKQRSTSTNLLTFTSIIIDAFESKSQLDVIFTDFSKAFDTPQFEILLHKLSNIGLNPLFLKWIESYLRGRKQKVLINGVESKSIEVHSGVPQGSHLGPIFFDTFINDIPSLFLSSESLLYADDLKIMKIIANSQDCNDLQFDLNVLLKWTKENKLHLNLSKCKVMSFFRKKECVEFLYSIGDHKLERVTTFKDLGVIFDQKLNFRDHIDYILAKSNSAFGFIRRLTKDFKNPLSIRSLYCALVRSHLEYASVIWDPAYKIHIDRIERVQKRFLIYYLQKVGGFFDSNLALWQNIQNLPHYTTRCEISKLNSLADRRKMAASALVADVLCSRIDAPEFLASIKILVPSKPVREPLFIYLTTFKNNFSFNAPVPNICRQFNADYNVFDFNLSKSLFKKYLKL